MKIEVTQKDIDKANKISPKNRTNAIHTCIVATALRRVTKKKWTVGCALAYTRGHFNSFLLPKRVTKKITDWTEGKPVKPFSFILSK